MSINTFWLAVICLAAALCVPVADAALVPLSDIVMVKGGVSYSLALKSDGTVLAWGDNSAGQLGDGTN
jgi:alpha-tubulin suppressor-like RCC1 family protein